MNNKKFIRTTDRETIENLKRLGFQLVSESNGVFTFINDTNKPITFDNKKLAYTNNITI